jgi:hypothetical protein
MSDNPFFNQPGQTGLPQGNPAQQPPQPQPFGAQPGQQQQQPPVTPAAMPQGFGMPQQQPPQGFGMQPPQGFGMQPPQGFGMQQPPQPQNAAAQNAMNGMMNHGRPGQDQLMQQMMGGFDEVTGGGLGVYLTSGNYYLKVEECKNGYAPQGNFPFFVTRFEVVQTDSPNFQPGSPVEHMIAFKDARYTETYQRNVKEFLFAAFNSKFPNEVRSLDQISTEMWQRAVAEDQPLKGTIVMCQSVAKPKKNTPGETFTRNSFMPYHAPPAAG